MNLLQEKADMHLQLLTFNQVVEYQHQASIVRPTVLVLVDTWRQTNFVQEFTQTFGANILAHLPDSPFVAPHTYGNQYLKILHYYETCEELNPENIDTTQLHEFVKGWFTKSSKPEALFQQVDAAVGLLLQATVKTKYINGEYYSENRGALLQLTLAKKRNIPNWFVAVIDASAAGPIRINEQDNRPVDDHWTATQVAKAIYEMHMLSYNNLRVTRQSILNSITHVPIRSFNDRKLFQVTRLQPVGTRTRDYPPFDFHYLYSLTTSEAMDTFRTIFHHEIQNMVIKNYHWIESGPTILHRLQQSLTTKNHLTTYIATELHRLLDIQLQRDNSSIAIQHVSNEMIHGLNVPVPVPVPDPSVRMQDVQVIPIPLLIEVESPKAAGSNSVSLDFSDDSMPDGDIKSFVELPNQYALTPPDRDMSDPEIGLTAQYVDSSVNNAGMPADVQMHETKEEQVVLTQSDPRMDLVFNSLTKEQSHVPPPPAVAQPPQMDRASYYPYAPAQKSRPALTISSQPEEEKDDYKALKAENDAKALAAEEARHKLSVAVAARLREVQQQQQDKLNAGTFQRSQPGEPKTSDELLQKFFQFRPAQKMAVQHQPTPQASNVLHAASPIQMPQNIGVTVEDNLTSNEILTINTKRTRQRDNTSMPARGRKRSDRSRSRSNSPSNMSRASASKTLGNSGRIKSPDNISQSANQIRRVKIEPVPNTSVLSEIPIPPQVDEVTVSHLNQQQQRSRSNVTQAQIDRAQQQIDLTEVKLDQRQVKQGIHKPQQQPSVTYQGQWGKERSKSGSRKSSKSSGPRKNPDSIYKTRQETLYNKLLDLKKFHDKLVADKLAQANAGSTLTKKKVQKPSKGLLQNMRDASRKSSPAREIVYQIEQDQQQEQSVTVTEYSEPIPYLNLQSNIQQDSIQNTQQQRDEEIDKMFEMMQASLYKTEQSLNQPGTVMATTTSVKQAQSQAEPNTSPTVAKKFTPVYETAMLQQIMPVQAVEDWHVNPTAVIKALQPLPDAQIAGTIIFQEPVIARQPLQVDSQSSSSIEVLEVNDISDRLILKGPFTGKKVPAPSPVPQPVQQPVVRADSPIDLDDISTPQALTPQEDSDDEVTILKKRPNPGAIVDERYKRVIVNTSTSERVVTNEFINFEPIQQFAYATAKPKRIQQFEDAAIAIIEASFKTEEGLVLQPLAAKGVQAAVEAIWHHRQNFAGKKFRDRAYEAVRQKPAETSLVNNVTVRRTAEGMLVTQVTWPFTVSPKTFPKPALSVYHKVVKADIMQSLPTQFRHLADTIMCATASQQTVALDVLTLLQTACSRSPLIDAHALSIANKLLIDLLGLKTCMTTYADNASVWARMHEAEDFGFSGKYGIVRDIINFNLEAPTHPYEAHTFMSDQTERYAAALTGRLIGKLAMAVGFPNLCTTITDKRPYSIDGTAGRYVMHFMKWFINVYMEPFSTSNLPEVHKLNRIFSELSNNTDKKVYLVNMLEAWAKSDYRDATLYGTWGKIFDRGTAAPLILLEVDIIMTVLKQSSTKILHQTNSDLVFREAYVLRIAAVLNAKQGQFTETAVKAITIDRFYLQIDKAVTTVSKQIATRLQEIQTIVGIDMTNLADMRALISQSDGVEQQRSIALITANLALVHGMTVEMGKQEEAKKLRHRLYRMQEQLSTVLKTYRNVFE